MSTTTTCANCTSSGSVEAPARSRSSLRTAWRALDVGCSSNCATLRSATGCCFWMCVFKAATALLIASVATPLSTNVAPEERAATTAVVTGSKKQPPSNVVRCKYGIRRCTGRQVGLPGPAPVLRRAPRSLFQSDGALSDVVMQTPLTLAVRGAHSRGNGAPTRGAHLRERPESFHGTSIRQRGRRAALSYSWCVRRFRAERATGSHPCRSSRGRAGVNISGARSRSRRAQVREAKQMLDRGESPNHVARVLRVGRSTLYRAIAAA
jgi:hypothetical protein